MFLSKHLNSEKLDLNYCKKNQTNFCLVLRLRLVHFLDAFYDEGQYRTN